MTAELTEELGRVRANENEGILSGSRVFIRRLTMDGSVAQEKINAEKSK
ncbi:MAG: hypothetical protein LBP79_06950 [Clostridiales bacterium]|jgi:hypothetical protein|nr:hypothetical protein [Clostridiales bacterium]